MEYLLICPYCWKEISFILDTSVTVQTYVEDCEVCCNPIEIKYEIINGEVAVFEAIKIQ